MTAVARRRGRYGHRDSTAILVAYRHALRVSELCVLRWDAVDLESGPHTRPDARERQAEPPAKQTNANRCRKPYPLRSECHWLGLVGKLCIVSNTLGYDAVTRDLD